MKMKLMPRVAILNQNSAVNVLKPYFQNISVQQAVIIIELRRKLV
jgi:hypothetical protein